MSNAEKIFVYGTLRPPQDKTLPEDSRYYPHIQSYVKSAVPAQIFNAELYNLGSHPAAQPGQGTVHGDLLTVKAGALEVTDRVEGHPQYFRREKVEVKTTTKRSKAWIYWAPKGLVFGTRRISCGDWFRRNSEDCRDSDSVASDSESAELKQVDDVLKTLVRRFADSECSWFSSVRPQIRAHSVPVWHVWRRGRAYVITTPNAVKAANISKNPSVVITHPDPLDPIIIEGWATLAPGAGNQLRPLFLNKYNWDISSDSEYQAIIEITPTKLMAWGKHGEGRWAGDEVLRVWLE